jgi:hypothetical protein
MLVGLGHVYGSGRTGETASPSGEALQRKRSLYHTPNKGACLSYSKGFSLFVSY